MQASADGKSVVVETYGSDFTLLAAKTIAGELTDFGGFYTDGTYNFLVFAQSNTSESDSTEVFRVVKYDRDWNRLAAAGIFGSNTYIPLDAGSLRMTEAGGILYVRTCHEMYGGSGLHHQANMTFAVSVAAMQVTFNNCQVSNVSTGYVSHSFNQFIQADGGDLVMADHGDAYPRAIVLTRCSQTSPTSVSSVNVLNISGSVGNNVTGASLGGLETSSSGCSTAVLTASGTARISNLTTDAGTAAFDYDHATDGRRYTCIVTRYRNGKMISCLKTDGVKLAAGCNRIAADGGEACDVCKLFVLDESGAPAFEALGA